MAGGVRAKRTTSVDTERAETATARSQVYGFLATVFRAEMTEPLLAALEGPGLTEVLVRLGIDPSATIPDAPRDALLEELAVEYAQLFLGPGPHVSPHASVHKEEEGPAAWGQLWGEETVRVKRFVEAAGLEYDAGYAGLPDHISVELEFLGRLAAHEALAWEEGDAESALFCLGVERKFIDEHVRAWVPGFCDKVAEHARLPFYRNIATLTKAFIGFDRTVIGEMETETGR